MTVPVMAFAKTPKTEMSALIDPRDIKFNQGDKEISFPPFLLDPKKAEIRTIYYFDTTDDKETEEHEAEFLKKNGIMLNQQTFAHAAMQGPYGKDRFSLFMKALPDSIMSQDPDLTPKQKRQMAREKAVAFKKHLTQVKTRT